MNVFPVPKALTTVPAGPAGPRGCLLRPGPPGPHAEPPRPGRGGCSVPVRLGRPNRLVVHVRGAEAIRTEGMAARMTAASSASTAALDHVAGLRPATTPSEHYRPDATVGSSYAMRTQDGL